MTWPLYFDLGRLEELTFFNSVGIGIFKGHETVWNEDIKHNIFLDAVAVLNFIYFFFWSKNSILAVYAATGIWAPVGWKPFSSATYWTVYTWPSSAVYENEPRTEMASLSEPALLRTPDSSALIPLLVS